MRVMQIINKPVAFRKPGCCIYCGAEGELHREHIIPSALEGRLTIPAASCLECADNTHAFEGKVISGFYGDARAAIGMKRRGNRRKWGNKFVVHIDKGSSWKNLTITRPTEAEKRFEPIEVELEDHPAAIACVILEPAGIFTGNLDYHKRTFKIGIASPDGFQDRLKKLGGGVMIGGKRPDLEDVGLFLAKIAHSYAAALYGIGTFIPTLANAIRGHIDPVELWAYVGGPIEQLPLAPTRHLHVLTPFEFKGGAGERALAVRVRLFAPFNLPAYDVIVGKATCAVPSPL